MDRVPRRVDMRVGSDWFAVHTDFQQIGGGDLLEHQFMLLDQEVIWLSRHPHGEMIEDQVRPLAMFGVTMRGGELDARLPFSGRNAVLDRRVSPEPSEIAIDAHAFSP